LGKLEKGQRLTKSFVLKNNLKSEVKIIGSLVSAESLSATLPTAASIPPGEQIEVQAALTPSQVGFYREVLTFSVESPEIFPGTDSNTLTLSIEFQGRVLGGIVVLPQNLFLGVLDSSGKSIQRNVHIKTDGSQPFVLTKVAAEGFSVAAALSQTPQTAHEVQLSITPKPGSLSSGLVEGTIQIFTTHPDVLHLTIPLKAVRQ